MSDDLDRRAIPNGWVAGRRTPTFTASTVPPALLSDHRTTVWARLEVEAGTVRFVEAPMADDPRPDGSGFEDVADVDRATVIVPDRPHRIEPSPDARFAVQFFEAPAAAADTAVTA